MFTRLLMFAVTVTLIIPALGPVVAPEGTVAHASYEYCDYGVDAHAYLYSDSSEVGSSGGSGTFLDAQTSDQCASVAQQYAVFYAGEACGSSEGGVAYVVVEWRVWWAEEEVGGSPVQQQYDCGDV